MKHNNSQSGQQKNVEFNASEIKDRFDALSASVDQKIREADKKNLRSMAAAARFIANV